MSTLRAKKACSKAGAGRRLEMADCRYLRRAAFGLTGGTKTLKTCTVKGQRQSQQFLQELTHRGHAGVLPWTEYLDVSPSEIVLVQPGRVDGGQSVAQRGFDHADALVVCQGRSMATSLKFQSSAGNRVAVRRAGCKRVRAARMARVGCRPACAPTLSPPRSRRTCRPGHARSARRRPSRNRSPGWQACSTQQRCRAWVRTRRRNVSTAAQAGIGAPSSAEGFGRSRGVPGSARDFGRCGMAPT